MVYTTDHSNPPKDGSPRDIALNQQQDIFFSSSGDLAVVNGRENVEQSAAIDVLHTVDPEIGSRITPTSINRVQSRIRSVLEQDPQVETVMSVEPSEYNEDTSALSFEVETVADDGYTIPIQSMADRYTHDSDVDDDDSVTYLLADEKTY